MNNQPDRPPGSDRPVVQLMDQLRRLEPARIDLSLGRVVTVLDRLGNPHRRLPPVVHFAGTNGKGSSLALLRALLETDGRRVHAYTSPHLCRFNERIIVSGSMITDAALADVLDATLRAADGVGITFFEATTIAALLAFSVEPADVTLLETGLGGRLDATNVIDQPAVTAITPVGFDHMGFLGSTLAEIAGEKAGIIKAGRPVVIAPQPDQALEVLMRRASDLGSPAIIYGRDWRLDETGGDTGGGGTASVLSAAGAPDRDILQPATLPGAHQTSNAAMAVVIADRLNGTPVLQSVINRGLNAARWPGRLQRLGPGPLSESLPGVEIWIDAAHNDDGGRVLAAFLEQLHPVPTVLVCGMFQGKDTAAFLSHFRSRVTRVLAVSVDGEQPAQPVEDIIAAAARSGIPATAAVMPHVGEPHGLAARLEPPERRLVIAGSFAVIGRALAVNDQCPD